MTRPELIKELKSLVEGLIHADDWLKWWNTNESAVEKLLDPESVKRLKPAYRDSNAGAAHNSQTEAMAILKKEGIKVKRSNRYMEEFSLFMKDYIKKAGQEEKEKGNLIKTRVAPLAKKYPNLHKCLTRNAKKIETFDEGASSAEITKLEKQLKVSLPKSIQDFFKISKHFAVEGLSLDLDMICDHPGDKTKSDSKRYLCLGDYFWKADGDQILIEISRPASNPPILYYSHEEKGKILPLAKTWDDFLEKLPKQYLNQTFYYS